MPDQGLLTPAQIRAVLDRIEYGSRSECWRWLGAFNSDGRPVIGAGRDRISTLAYRRTYYIFRADQVPKGLQLDHVGCDDGTCVNPWHVEPATASANVRRHYDKVTHCPQGHPYDAENTYFRKRGGRDCRACNRDRQRRRQERQRSQTA